jgi:hypothetical protein
MPLLDLDAPGGVDLDAPFRLRHGLVDHPLFTIDALADLADFLPERLVEHHIGDVPAYLPDGDAARLDLSPGEIARSIDANGCWMVLQHVESHPEYRALLDEILDQVEPLVPPALLPMSRRVGFVFLSGGCAVAPAHIDPEHNLLLEVQGTKRLSIGSWDEVSDEPVALERYFTQGQQHVLKMPPAVTTFDLGPGDGIHVPLYAPHWVENGPAPCVALAVTFHTAGLRRTERVHSFNAHLRRLGVDPRPPGRTRFVDAAKAATIGGWEQTVGRLRKRKR